MSFTIGDIAVVVRGPKYIHWQKYEKWIGRQVVVSGPPGRAPILDPCCYAWKEAYPVDFNGATAWLVEECLEKMQPPKLIEEAGEWELCPWNPYRQREPVQQ